MNQGKYVLSQVFEVMSRFEFDKCVSRYRGNHSIKTFTCWEQFIVMVFAQLSYRESLRDIELCIGSLKTKMYHCGIRSAIARSTLAKANEKRAWHIYADFSISLIKVALPVCKGDNKLCAELKTLIYAFDSTTIDLCMALFGWASFRKTKSAVKMHVLLNIDGAIPEFVSITDGKTQDVKLLDAINYNSGCFYLIDKAYIDFRRLYRIELKKAFFVTRAKDNMAYVVTDTLEVCETNGIQKDELIQLKWHHGKRKYPIVFRRIEYIDPDTKLHLTFITNHLGIEALTVARLYKERWKVELFFKWIKQHLKIKRFYGNSENAVKTQIWIATCTYLMVAIMRKQHKIEASLSQVMQVLSLNLFEKCTIKELFEKQEPKNISNQPQLF